jgi:hypothetical protein
MVAGKRVKHASPEREGADREKGDVEHAKLLVAVSDLGRWIVPAGNGNRFRAPAPDCSADSRSDIYIPYARTTAGIKVR